MNIPQSALALFKKKKYKKVSPSNIAEVLPVKELKESEPQKKKSPLQQQPPLRNSQGKKTDKIVLSREVSFIAGGTLFIRLTFICSFCIFLLPCLSGII